MQLACPLQMRLLESPRQPAGLTGCPVQLLAGSMVLEGLAGSRAAGLGAIGSANFGAGCKVLGCDIDDDDDDDDGGGGCWLPAQIDGN